MTNIDILHLRELADRACSNEEMRPQSLIDMGFDSNFYYKFLYLLAKEFSLDTMVELGTLHGGGAFHLAYGNPRGKVISIDNHQIVKEPLPQNLTLIEGDTCDFSKINLPYKSVNLLFIDSAHIAKQAMNEYVSWLPYVKPGGIILIDDLYMDGMEGFWGLVTEPKFPHDDLHSTCGFGVAIHQ